MQVRNRQVSHGVAAESHSSFSSSSSNLRARFERRAGSESAQSQTCVSSNSFTRFVYASPVAAQTPPSREALHRTRRAPRLEARRRNRRRSRLGLRRRRERASQKVRK